MSIRKRIGTGLLISAFALGGLAGCASGDQTREDESAAQEWEEAGEATAEAAESTAESAGETAKRGADEVEEKAKDVREGTRVTAERAEKQVEGWIGGGPVESDTQRKIEEINREMDNYRKGIEQHGHQIDDVTRLRMQQIEERAELVRKQYNELATEANMGVAEIDAQLQSVAEDVKDDWEDLEDDLEDDLGRSYENADDL